MAHMVGFLLGIIIVSVSCGVASYFIWEKMAGPKHTGKQLFFAFFCFGVGGLSGLIGGIPALLISWAVARIFKVKKEPAQTPALEDSSNENVA